MELHLRQVLIDAGGEGFQFGEELIVLLALGVEL